MNNEVALLMKCTLRYNEAALTGKDKIFQLYLFITQISPLHRIVNTSVTTLRSFLSILKSVAALLSAQTSRKEKLL